MAKLHATVSLDAGKIGKMIDDIAKRSGELKTDIQVTAVSCALHAAKHADTTLMQKLDDCLGDGWYRATLRAWAVKNGPFGYRVKEETDKHGKVLPVGFTYIKAKADALNAEYAAGDAACITRLIGERWETTKKEPAFEGFDFLAILERAVKKADKVTADETKSKHPKTKIDPDLLKAARELVSAAKLGSGDAIVEDVGSVH